MDTPFPKIHVIDIPGKGQGVVALDSIPYGALIIAETPRMTVPLTDSISDETMKFLMSFPCKDGDDPLTGRFKHFLPMVGSKRFNAGLFMTICKINHICPSPLDSPNAVYFWDDASGHELLHAIRDIPRGTEITVSYIYNNPSASADPIPYLLARFGFRCTCAGCARTIAERQRSGERIKDYHSFVDDVPFQFSTRPPLAILDDLEKQTLIICEEGYFGELWIRAYDALQLCAMYKDGKSASEWGVLSRDGERVYRGEGHEQLKKIDALIKNPSSFRQWGALGSKKLRGPSKGLLAYAYPIKTEVTTGKSSISAHETANPGDVSTCNKPLSKGQKKYAKAKAKKAAIKKEKAE